jgi:hypothetical protein
MKQGEKVKAGYLYKYPLNDYKQIVTYCVCIGKILYRVKSTLLFLEFDAPVPYDATLESYPLTRLNTRSITTTQLFEEDCDRLICVGKVADATEESIKTWLTQLKLAGYILRGNFGDSCYIGDWDKRKKLPCVKKFGVGKIYVPEELAYIKVRIPYRKGDRGWCYRGKQGENFIWHEWYLMDESKYVMRPYDIELKYRAGIPMVKTRENWELFYNGEVPIQKELKRQYKNMVLYNPNIDGYQIV